MKLFGDIVRRIVSFTSNGSYILNDERSKNVLNKVKVPSTTCKQSQKQKVQERYRAYGTYDNDVKSINRGSVVSKKHNLKYIFDLSKDKNEQNSSRTSNTGASSITEIASHSKAICQCSSCCGTSKVYLRKSETAKRKHEHRGNRKHKICNVWSNSNFSVGLIKRKSAISSKSLYQLETNIPALGIKDNYEERMKTRDKYNATKACDTQRKKSKIIINKASRELGSISTNRFCIGSRSSFNVKRSQYINQYASGLRREMKNTFLEEPIKDILSIEMCTLAGKVKRQKLSTTSKTTCDKSSMMLTTKRRLSMTKTFMRKQCSSSLLKRMSYMFCKSNTSHLNIQSHSNTAKTSQFQIKKLKTEVLKTRLVGAHDTPIKEEGSTLSYTNNTKHLCIHSVSTMNFDIDSYKNRNTRSGADTKAITKKVRDKSSQDIAKHRSRSNKNITSNRNNHARHHSEYNGQRAESIGSGDSNSVQRCLCTLMLQNIGPNIRKNKSNLDNVSAFSSVIATKRVYKHLPDVHKYLRTKTCIRRRNEPWLEPFDCKPNAFVPGLCEDVNFNVKNRNLVIAGIRPGNHVMQSVRSINRGRLPHMKQLQTLPESFAAGINTHQKILEELPLLDWRDEKIDLAVGSNEKSHKETVPMNNNVSLNVNNVKREIEKNNNASGDTSKLSYRHPKTPKDDNEIETKLLSDSKTLAAGKSLNRCGMATFHHHNDKNVRKQSITIGRAETSLYTPFKPYRCKHYCQKDYCSCVKNMNSGQIYRNVQTATQNRYLKEKYLKPKPRIRLSADVITNVSKKTVSLNEDLPKTVTVIKVTGTDVDLETIGVESRHESSLNRDLSNSPGYTTLKCPKTCSYRKLLNKVVPHRYSKLTQDNTSIDRTEEDMKTILPYEPQTFKNHRSKTSTHLKTFYDKCDSVKQRHLSSIFKKFPGFHRGKDVKGEDSSNTPDLRIDRNQEQEKRYSASPGLKLSKCPKYATANNKKIHINIGRVTNYCDNTSAKRVRFDLDNLNRTCPRNIICSDYASGDATHNTMDLLQHITTLKKRQSTIFECLKILCGKKHVEENKIAEDPDYTEIKIRGKRLLKDVCEPIDPKENTLITVSGSYVGCEITKRHGDTERPRKNLCRKTCVPCKVSDEIARDNEKLRRSCHCVKCLCPKKSYSQGRLSGVKVLVNSSNENNITKKEETHKKDLKPKNNKKGEKKRKNMEKGKGKQIEKNKKKKECKCGSSICHKVNKQNDLADYQLPKMSCICGNTVCKKQFKKKKNKLKNKLAAKKEKERRRELERFRNELIREEMKRRRGYAWEDRKAKWKERCQHKVMLREAEKGNVGDLVLVSESVLDIGRLGLNVVGDVVRLAGREIRNPLTAYQRIKTMVKSPAKLMAGLSTMLKKTLFIRTLNTIKLIFARMTRMSFCRCTLDLMESHRFTNYLAHPCNRKKRMKKFKKITKKEPLDFGCSPYMASLRKKPFLCIYNRCPWFYPHCISLKTLWTQFTDLILFLLAVIVWSPCLLTIEILRFFVCCCLCTA